MGRYRLRARAGWYSVLIGESNVAIDPAIGGYGVEDIYLGEFSSSPHRDYIQYLQVLQVQVTYPSGLSPAALSSGHRKNTGVNLK